MIAVNNVVHLLVKICLPLQHGIEVIGAVRALLGADHRDTDNIPHDLFQWLAVLLIHGEHEEGQHDKHHTHGCHAVSRRPPKQEEKRYADERPAAEADQLPLG